MTAERIEEAASASSPGTVALSDSGYRVTLVEGRFREALRRLQQMYFFVAAMRTEGAASR